MQAHQPERFEFRGLVLDLRTRTLSRLGRNIPIRPKSFDVLAHLLRNAGKLVTKDEIVKAVWQDVIATDESLSRCISDARSAIGDNEKEIIRTVPGRGYHFAAEVTLGASSSRSLPATAGAAKLGRRSYALAAAALLAVVFIVAVWSGTTGVPEETRSVRPSILILPFRNNSADPAIDRFASGLTADLNAALARLPDLLVISESAARKYATAPVDARQAAKETGVLHVLSGTVQAEGRDLRIAVQLTEGKSGLAVWSQSYDRGADRFLQVQEEVVREVIVALQIELTDGEAIRAESRGTDNLEAWLLNFEALSEGFTFTQEGTFKARELFAEASREDPAWAAPVSGLAWTYREALRRGWSNDEEADRASWIALAEKCREINPDFFGCYIQLGNYYIENGEIERGIELREKALQLSPSDLSALSGLAWQLVLIGDTKRGLELLSRAKLVSPFHPPWLIATEAYAYQIEGQYEKAIQGFKYALEHGDFADWHARLAAVYAEAGDLENARAQAALFIEKRPNRRVSDLTQILKVQDPARTERYAEMLRKAGIPD